MTDERWISTKDILNRAWTATRPMPAWLLVSTVLSAHCYAAPGGWLATGPFGGSAELVRVIPKRPNMVLAATSNGLLYQSVDGGESWANRFFPAQFAGVLHSLEVDPRVPGTWYAAVESARIGHSGDRFVSLVTGLHVDTIRRGREELADSLDGRPADRVRLPGGGRPALEKKSPRSSRPC